MLCRATLISSCVLQAPKATQVVPSAVEGPIAAHVRHRHLSLLFNLRLPLSCPMTIQRLFTHHALCVAFLCAAGSRGCSRGSWRISRPQCSSGGLQASRERPESWLQLHSIAWHLYGGQDLQAPRGSVSLATVLSEILWSSLVACCRLPRQPKWFLAWCKAPLLLRWANCLEKHSKDHECCCTA